MQTLNAPRNALLIIQPYWTGGTWVFDDARIGVVREPFVCGAPEVISKMVHDAKIKKAENGFRLLFSAEPFPEATEFKWLKNEHSGAWYRAEWGAEFWLCSCIRAYYGNPPKRLFAKAESLS